MKNLVVLIPAFNEEKSIEKVIQSIPNKIAGYNNTVLVVDDGSTDNTRNKAEKAGAKVVSHSHNQGVGKAFQTGLEKALEMKADAMVNIDADGQFRSKDIERLLQPIVSGEADFVAADRFTDEDGKVRKPMNMPEDKYWGNLLMAKLVSFLANDTFSDVSSGFRAYSKKALLMLNLTGKFTYTQESFIDLAYKQLRIQQVPVPVKYFPGRKSKVANNLFKYGYRTLKIIIRTFRDYKPLLFFSYLSFIPFLFGLLSGLFFLTHYLLTKSFSPYKFIAFGSVYLLTLSLFFWIAGFIADMFVRVRMNQERILYQQKKQSYEN